MDVSLQRILRANADFFLNTWPMYVHEIAAFGADFYTLDERGRWQPDIAADWIADSTPEANLREGRHGTEASRQPFQRAYEIRCDGRPAGFACVGLAPFRHMPDDVDVILAELFLIRSHRGRGVAEAGLRKLFVLYPGRWFLESLEGNARAIRFWRRILPLIGVRDIEERREGGVVNWRCLADLV
jgi:predicted acetyltransferase